jgi:hypothetical protein
VELDLTEENLLDNIVGPYKAGKKLLCGGTIVDPFDIDTIQINETPQSSSEYLPMIRARNAASNVLTVIPDEWEVTEEGEVVTRKFINVAPGKQSRAANHEAVSENAQPVSKGGPYVFISHSSKDTTIVSAVKQAFQDLTVKPYFAEETTAGVPPSKEIAEAVKKSEALFVFFTRDALYGDTRDWIIFEIGVAVAHSRKIYSWKTNEVTKEQLPRLLEQVSKYREFNLLTSDDAIKLTGEIRKVAKTL